MKDLTKYYIDLSKLSEEERTSLPQILEKAGEKIGEKVYIHNTSMVLGYPYFHKPTYANYWTIGTCNSLPEKTKLTYPEFIELFEGGEGENNGWIKIESEADLPKDFGNYWVFWDNKVILQYWFTIDDYDLKKQTQDWMQVATHYHPIIKPLPPKF